MTSRIDALVRQLDGEADASYDARAELIRIGSAAIRPLINGLPSLGGFGQLTAIEVFEEVGDPRGGPALIGLLDSDNPSANGRRSPWRTWRSRVRSSPCDRPTAPAWNGPSRRTGPSPTASAGP
ncbi:hypothetical protein ACIPJK_01465 [Streptomyces roseus]|uniref:hypothetical protein n=1 Tax=Streptomyces roseus TaxID=66430 RepID=UPI003829C2BB